MQYILTEGELKKYKDEIRKWKNIVTELCKRVSGDKCPYNGKTSYCVDCEVENSCQEECKAWPK